MNIVIGLLIAGLVIGLIVFAMSFKNTGGLEPMQIYPEYKLTHEYAVFENNLNEYFVRVREVMEYTDGTIKQNKWVQIGGAVYANKDEALNEMTYRIAKQNATEKRIA